MHATPSPHPTFLYSALQAAAWGGDDDDTGFVTLSDIDDDEWRVGGGRCSYFFSDCEETKANVTAATRQVARNLGLFGGVTVFLVCLFACCMNHLHREDEGSSTNAYSTASQV